MTQHDLQRRSHRRRTLRNALTVVLLAGCVTGLACPAQDVSAQDASVQNVNGRAFGCNTADVANARTATNRQLPKQIPALPPLPLKIERLGSRETRQTIEHTMPIAVPGGQTSQAGTGGAIRGNPYLVPPAAAGKPGVNGQPANGAGFYRGAASAVQTASGVADESPQAARLLPRETTSDAAVVVPTNDVTNVPPLVLLQPSAAVLKLRPVDGSTEDAVELEDDAKATAQQGQLQQVAAPQIEIVMQEVEPAADATAAEEVPEFSGLHFSDLKETPAVAETLTPTLGSVRSAEPLVNADFAKNLPAADAAELADAEEGARFRLSDGAGGAPSQKKQDGEDVLIPGALKLQSRGRVAIRVAQNPLVSVAAEASIADGDSDAYMLGAEAAFGDTVSTEPVSGQALIRPNHLAVPSAANAAAVVGPPTPQTLEQLTAERAGGQTVQPGVGEDNNVRHDSLEPAGQTVAKIYRPSRRLVIDVNQQKQTATVGSGPMLRQVSAAEMEAERVFAGQPTRKISIQHAQSHSLSPQTAVQRVQLENREICEAVLVGPHKLLLIGRQVGSTRLAIWCGDDEQPELHEINVVSEKEAPLGASLEAVAQRLTETIRATYPGCRIRVIAQGDGLTVIGQASNQSTAREIMRLVRSACLETVNDRLEVR
ncbi:pilus assembly protein N-terminal domain-containing protein [Planctomycetaceae bacterium SH139]